MKKNSIKKQEGTSLKRIISNMFFLLKYAFKAAPLYTLHKLVSYSANRIIVFFEHTWMLGYIIDSVNEGRPFRDVAVVILIIFITTLLWSSILNNFMYAYVSPTASKKIEMMINKDLYSKAAAIDLACYDNPQFYDDYVWAVSSAPGRITAIINTLDAILGCIIGIVLGASYFLTQDTLGLVVVVISFFTTFFISKLQQKINFKRAERCRPHERKQDYIGRLLFLNDHSKEIRLNDIINLLYDEYHKASLALANERKRDSKKQIILTILGSYIFNTFIQSLYTLFLLFKTIVLKTISYGAIVVLYKSCGYVSGNMRNLASNLPKLQEHSRYIEKIRYFLEYDVKITSPEVPKMLDKNGGTIELKNVTFSYEEAPVLKNINMTIRRGEKIALVGYNGAGKTTLVKLIMRLYDPVEGEIRYQGNNIKDYRLKDYRDLFETVFQDFQLFAMSVGENITLDTVPIDINRAEKAITTSGFSEKLNTMPFGYSTPITREFDNNGALLSGGEEQKLAIARALYKNSPIIILDEPSSALDPVAEYNLNHTMLGLQNDKTVITISHRLSTTRMADKIYMLEKGEIIESGTHDELMKLNGKYAEMFKLQSQKYRSE